MTATLKLLLAGLLIASAGLFCPRVAHAADPQWTLVWDDEFNGAADAPPDPTRWTYDLGGGGWGNNELETYTSATANVYQDGNGHLVIQAQKNGSNYSSARLKSLGLFDQAYGMVEASIELPAGTAQGSGLWPAFWMLGSNINSSPWPSCGEIDIMENIAANDTASENAGHIHGPVEPGGADYYGGDGVGTTYTLPAGEAMNTAYHLYAVAWNPTSITYYVDGVAYQTLTAADLPSGGKWVFNHPFFILLNMAIGGTAGSVSATFPQQLLVDYVRVYKLTDDGSSPYGGTAISLPGTIPSASYDSYDDAADPGEPGEGFAYNGLNSTQTNGVTRTGDAVSTENCGDLEPYDCDYTSPGQWLQYSVDVTQSGVYTVDARVASDEGGGSFHVDVDGTTVTGEMTAPNTGGWQTWADVTSGGITLSAGTHVVLLDEDSMGSGDLGVCNFEYLKFSLQPTSTPTASFTSSPSVSPTFSATASPSGSPTRTPTGSPSASVTAALSATVTPTFSASPSVSATPTDSPTSSTTPAVSATPSFTPASPTATQTASASPTQTQSPSVTASVSVTADATLSSSPTATPRARETPTSTASPKPLTETNAGSGGILKVLPVPNPNPSHLAVEVEPGCPYLRAQIYTEAMVLVADWTTPVNVPGWQRVALPPQFLNQAASESYFYKIVSGDSGTPVLGSFVRLR